MSRSSHKKNRRTIPNEAGALLDALNKFNETPEGKKAMGELGSLLRQLDNTTNELNEALGAVKVDQNKVAGTELDPDK
jgi:hypothetical protein